MLLATYIKSTGLAGTCRPVFPSFIHNQNYSTPQNSQLQRGSIMANVTSKSAAVKEGPPSFFIFPPEIRLKIYRLLLVNSEPLDLDYHGAEKLSCAILCTNSVVFSEAFPVLYRENTWNLSDFDMEIWNDERQGGKMHCWLSKMMRVSNLTPRLANLVGGNAILPVLQHASRFHIELQYPVGNAGFFDEVTPNRQRPYHLTRKPTVDPSVVLVLAGVSSIDHLEVSAGCAHRPTGAKPGETDDIFWKPFWNKTKAEAASVKKVPVSKLRERGVDVRSPGVTNVTEEDEGVYSTLFHE